MGRGSPARTEISTHLPRQKLPRIGLDRPGRVCVPSMARTLLLYGRNCEIRSGFAALTRS